MTAGKLIEECNRQGLRVKMRETFRTVEEQSTLYTQGRTRPGDIVTNTPGSSYNSYHRWGTASDICRNDGTGTYNDAGSLFSKVGAVEVSLGLEWGGS